MKWVFLVKILIKLTLMMIIILWRWSWNYYLCQTWAWFSKFEKQKGFKKDLSKELMSVLWHSKRWLGWFMLKDEKKEIDSIFTDEAGNCWKLAEGVKMLLLAVGSMIIVLVGRIWFVGIETFWDKKLCMKTWYNSFCVIFVAQSISILSNHILLSCFTLQISKI